MTTIATGDEVQTAARRRVQGRVNGFTSDHGDRRRWQASIGISVVRRRFAQVGAGDLAVVTLSHAVDHGRVGLQ
ncbi:hypothetical protein D3C84_772260 [compost metagenome]